MPPADGVSMLRNLWTFSSRALLSACPNQRIYGDPVKLGFHAHALKSMSLNLGAKRIVELCRKLEDLAAPET